MDCWILYDAEDLESNRFFAERLKACGEGLGMSCGIVTKDGISMDDLPEVVVNRSRDAELAAVLEDCGCTVYNRSSVTRVCNDKSATYELMRMINVPFLPYSSDPDKKPDGPPWVVKSCIGHGGTEVLKADDEEGLQSCLDRLKGRKPIIQEMAEPGKDMRMYVLGGKVIATVLRSSETDFRANFKLGGKAELIDPPQRALTMVKRILPELLPDFIGVDFVFRDGEPYLNEIEDDVGTRMLYALTDMDPARMYMEYISQH